MRLRHLLDYQEKPIVQNPTGENVAPYETKFSVFADIEPLEGDERVWPFAKVQAVVTHKITTHYNCSINVKGQFLFGSRVFQIQAVLNDKERNRYLTIMASEKV